MKPAELCVILVNYNGYADTLACLNSIKEAEKELPFVIVVDNASKNARQLEDLKTSYSKLKIIYSSENIGFGRANNVGIAWAQENIDFEYLLLLNNDTIVESDAFHYMIAAFKVNPKIGITTAKTMYEFNKELVWYGGGAINYKRGWPKIADYNQKPTPEGANKARYVSFVSGCVMMFTKQSIADLKGFDDDFFMYCEDLELSMRAQKKGYTLFYEPQAVIYHKVQGSMKKQSKSSVIGMKSANPNLEFLFYNMKSNQYLAMKKNSPLLKFLIFNIFYWLEFLFINLRMLKAKRFDIFNISTKTIKRIFNFY